MMRYNCILSPIQEPKTVVFLGENCLLRIYLNILLEYMQEY